MASFLIILKLYFFYLICLFVLLNVGQFLTKLILKGDIDQNIWFRHLFNAFIGLLIFSTLTAVISSKGVTTQIVIIPLIIILYYILSHKEKATIHFYDKRNASGFKGYNYKIIFIISLISFLLFAVFYYAPFSVDFIKAYPDTLYYSNISQYLVKAGIESHYIHFSPFTNIFSYTTLYHYTDLWFNGFISLLFNISSIQALLFVTYPILLFMAIVGILSIVDTFLSVNIYFKILIAILIICATNIYIFQIQFSLYYYSKCFYFNPYLFFTSSKLLIIFPSLIIGIKYLVDNKVLLACILFSIAIVTYNTLVPALTGGVMTICFYYIYISYRGKNKQNLYQVIYAIVIFLATVLSLFLFTNIFGAFNETNDFVLFPLKTTFILIGENIIKPFLIFSPLVFLICYIFIKKRIYLINPNFIALILGSLISASIYISLNHYLFDIRQILDNIMPILLIIFSAYLIKVFCQDTSIVKYIFLFAAILIFFYNNFYAYNYMFKPFNNKNYSSEFVRNIYEELSKNENTVFLFAIEKHPAFGWDASDRTNFIQTHPKVSRPLEISYYLTNNAYEFCKQESNFETPLCHKINNNHGYPLDSTVLNFISQSKAKYIYIEEGAFVPDYLQKHLRLISKDKITKNCFYGLIF